MATTVSKFTFYPLPQWKKTSSLPIVLFRFPGLYLFRSIWASSTFLNQVLWSGSQWLRSGLCGWSKVWGGHVQKHRWRVEEKFREETISYWGEENPPLSAKIAYPPRSLSRVDLAPEDCISLITDRFGVDSISVFRIKLVVCLLFKVRWDAQSSNDAGHCQFSLVKFSNTLFNVLMSIICVNIDAVPWSTLEKWSSVILWISFSFC